MSTRWGDDDQPVVPIVDQFGVQAVDYSLFCVNMGQTVVPLTLEQLAEARQNSELRIRTLLRFFMTREDLRRWRDLLGRVLEETEESE